MVLTSSELTRKAIVHGAVVEGLRPTTYDATVGSIIRRGVEVNEPSFTLRPRHIVWLVSAETFDLGDSTTGLATLKTQWTHQGVLALNVGVVDPGWNGPLAAAVVNLSSTDFVIERGQPFFRILFYKHARIPPSDLKRITRTPAEYVAQIKGYSRSFSPTFLDMDALTQTIAEKVLGMPRWGLILSLVAIVLGLLSITVPVGVSIWSDTSGTKAKIMSLEASLARLEATASKEAKIDPASCSPMEINKQRRLVCPDIMSH